jgi:hypothetical protein
MPPILHRVVNMKARRSRAALKDGWKPQTSDSEYLLHPRRAEAGTLRLSVNVRYSVANGVCRHGARGGRTDLVPQQTLAAI